MRSTKIVLIAVLIQAALASSGAGQVVLLGKARFETTGSAINETGVNRIQLRFAMQDTFELRPQAFAFEGVWFDTTHVGQFFATTVHTDTSFVMIDRMFTDCVSQYVGISSHTPGGLGTGIDETFSEQSVVL